RRHSRDTADGEVPLVAASSCSVPATAPAGSASTVSATFRTDAGSSGRSLRRSVRTPEERSDDAGMTGSVSEIAWRVNVLNVPVIAEGRSEEHTSELQSRENIVCRLLL